MGEPITANSFREFIRVKDCVLMTLTRFLSFSKDVHMQSANECSNIFKIRQYDTHC